MVEQVTPSRTHDNEAEVRTHRAGQAVEWLLHNRVRLAKSLLGVALLGAAFWQAHRTFVLTRSSEATIVSDFITISAPIDGFLQHASPPTGETFASTAVIASIDNPLIDRRAATELEAQLRVLDGEIASVSALLAGLESMGARFVSRDAQYTKRRSEQLALQLAQADARLEAEQARLEQANASLKRVEEGQQAGIASAHELEIARRDQAVALSQQHAAQQATATIRSAAEAMKAGILVGEFTTTDRSYSTQRADDVRLRVTDLQAQLTERLTQRTARATELEQLNQQLQRLAKAELLVPAAGCLWRVESAPGVYVRSGQPLFLLASSAGMRVIAYLNDWRYARLRVGDPATVEVPALRRKFEGSVAVLLGPPDAQPGPPIALPADLRNRYAVAVTVPDLPREIASRCGASLAAEVEFHRASRPRWWPL